MSIRRIGKSFLAKVMRFLPLNEDVEAGLKHRRIARATLVQQVVGTG